MKKIAITMGDAGGVGPEVALKAAIKQELRRKVSLILLGDKKVFEETAKICKLSLEGVQIEQVCKVDNFVKGEPTEASAKAAYECIKRALEGCLAGEFYAMVTAPISKQALKMAGIKWPGHTEMLAEMTNTRDYAMMLIGGPLKVVLATIHVPLRKVAELITQELILQKIRLAHKALKMFDLTDGIIGVSSLNPHAGENRILGEEEEEIIKPAIERARAEGINVIGPVAADIVFHKAYQGEIDIVVSMYHDHALAPLKMIAFDRGVNLTLGLPIIRTSPDHGTAYDIAYKGIAREDSIVEAIRLAASLKLP